MDKVSVNFWCYIHFMVLCGLLKVIVHMFVLHVHMFVLQASADFFASLGLILIQVDIDEDEEDLTGRFGVDAVPGRFPKNNLLATIQYYPWTLKKSLACRVLSSSGRGGS